MQLILVPLLGSRGPGAEQCASRLQRPPAEMAEGLFSPCLLHARTPEHSCACRRAFPAEPCALAAGHLNHLELHSGSFRGTESEGWRWAVLEAIKLLFVGPNVEEVRAGIFNPLEMIRDEEHKGGLDEHFAPKLCGS